MNSTSPLLPQGTLDFYQQGWDWRKFQTFVLDLLQTGLELPVSENGVESMRRVMGAEAGPKEGVSQDFDVVAKLVGGQIWGVECKHWRKWDLPKAKAAVEKASKFPADHYVLAVACEVDLEGSDYFRSLPNWELWTGSRLTSLLSIRAPRERAARVIAKHFGADAVRSVFPLHDEVLLNAEDFLARFQQPGRLFHHHTRLIARQNALDTAVEFVNGSRKKVLIIKARGGEGKSRLLAEIGTRAPELMPGREVKFVNEYIRPDVAAPGMLSVEWEKAVIIQDDAHRLDHLRPDIISAVARHEGAKLIIATRPQAVEGLRDQLRRAGMDATQVESKLLELPRLKPAEMRELAREVLTPEFHAGVGQLASWSGDSPLICVIGGGLINQGVINFTLVMSAREFHDEVFRRFEQDNLDTCVCPPLLREDAGRLLRVIALLSPVKAAVLFEGLEKQFGWRRLDAEERLRYLKEAELVVETGAGLRVSPDLLADHLVYVASLADGQPGPLLLETLRGFGENMWPTLLANLSQAEWRGEQEHGRRADITAPLWDKFREMWESSDANVQQGMVNHWANYAFFQPGRSLDLADLVLAPRTEEDPHYFLVRQALLPVLRTIAGFWDAHRLAALERLWILARQWPEKQLLQRQSIAAVLFQDDGPETVWQAIAGLVKFKPGLSVERSLEVYEWVDGLLLRPEERWLLETHHRFFATVLSEAFVREVEGREIPFQREQLTPRNGERLRRKVLTMIRERLLPHSPMACSSAVSVLRAGMDRIVHPPEDAPANIQKSFKREQKLWRPSRLESLAVLEEIALRHDEPFLHYRIHQKLRHHFQYEEDEVFLAAARKVHAQLKPSLTFDVCRIVLGFHHDEFNDARWHRNAEFMKSGDWIRQSDEAFLAFAAAKAGELLSQFPDNTELERWASGFSSRARDFGFGDQHWHQLASAIGKTNPVRTESLLADFLEGRHPLLSRAMNALLGTLSVDMQIPWILRMLDSSRPEPFAAVLWHLVWNKRDTLPEAVWQKVKHIASTGTPERQSLVAGFVGNMLQLDALGQELISALPAQSLLSGPLQNITSRLGREPAHSLASFPKPIWAKLCDALLEVPSLNEDHWAPFLMKLNDVQPRLAYEFYRRRIEHLESMTTAGDAAAALYSPLPWRFDWWDIKGFDTEPDFASIADDLMTRALLDTPYTRCWKQLFWVAVVQPSAAGAALISDRLSGVSTSAEVHAIISLISRQGSVYVYRHPEFVKTVLAMLPRFPTRDATEIRARLLASGHPRGWGATNGELDPQFGYALEEARRANALHFGDAVLQAFYGEIITAEEELRETLRRRFQETD